MTLVCLVFSLALLNQETQVKADALSSLFSNNLLCHVFSFLKGDQKSAEALIQRSLIFFYSFPSVINNSESCGSDLCWW